jgi:hypothetical protein
VAPTFKGAFIYPTVTEYPCKVRSAQTKYSSFENYGFVQQLLTIGTMTARSLNALAWRSDGVHSDSHKQGMSSSSFFLSGKAKHHGIIRSVVQ